jgi:stearoyl-CoA desaturase (delta-9 desaturase)
VASPSTQFSPESTADAAVSPTTAALAARVVTLLLVVGPPVAVLAAVLIWRRPIATQDVVLAVAFYAIAAFGITVGFHRLFTHRSFRANRPLKVLLAVAGSTAVQGSLVSWVALHRQHHRFADGPGDPHSARATGPGVGAQLRSLAHAHVGWLFSPNPPLEERYAPDLLRDRDLRTVSNLFPVLAVAPFVLAAVIGWWISGSWQGALSAVLWAGVARMMLLHHVAWSINSICHAFGQRPATNDDLSTNCGALALFSLGESWHNFHHAYPACARHGALPHQWDASARLISAFERIGWATHVRWPTAEQHAAIRQRALISAVESSTVESARTTGSTQ